MAQVIVLIAIALYSFFYYMTDQTELAKLLRFRGNTPKTKVVALELQEKFNGMRIAIKEDFNNAEHIIQGYMISKQFNDKECSEYDVFGTEVYGEFKNYFSSGEKIFYFLGEDGDLKYVIKNGDVTYVGCKFTQP